MALFRLISLSILALLLVTMAHGQELDSIEGEEIEVTLTVQQQGATLIPAVLVGKELFIPLFDVFQFLRIRSVVSMTGDSISGFFLHEARPYLVDFAEGRIHLGDTVHTLQRGDYIKTEMSVFVRRDLFLAIFGFDCQFNFRAMTVNVLGKIDFPFLREMRRERLRKNLVRLNDGTVADTLVNGRSLAPRLGVLDWNLTWASIPGERDIVKADLAAGMGLLGGDAALRWSLSSAGDNSLRDLGWEWNHVRNDWTLFRQLRIGRIASVGRNTRTRGILGVALSNAPTTIRKTYGTYVVDGQAEAGWTVELLMNNVLIDVTEADAFGYYSFNVPLLYGTTAVTVKVYGPWGEERMEERVINIPFNVLPTGEFEYTASMGIPDDNSDALASSVRGSFGLGTGLTLAASMDIEAAAHATEVYPALSATMRPFDHVLINAEHVLNEKSSLSLVYALPGNATLSGEWSLYDAASGSLSLKGSEQRRIQLHTPFSLGSSSGNLRMGLRQDVAAGGEFTAAELHVGATILGVRSQMSINVDDLLDRDRAMLLTVGTAHSLFRGLLLRPQFSIDILGQRGGSAQLGVESPLGKSGWLTATLGSNLMDGSWNAQLAVRFDFSFARVLGSLARQNSGTRFTQSVRGSVQVDDTHASLHLDPDALLRRGGLVVETFLDVNGNGLRDAGERRIPGIELRTTGGRILVDAADTLVRVFDIEPYQNVLVEVSSDNFENVAWQARHTSFGVEILPNRLIALAVPVSVVGEVVGKVALPTGFSRKHAGGLQLRIHAADGSLAATVVTEKDGSFRYMGLLPGRYTVTMDDTQAQRLSVTGDAVAFEVRADEEGDIVEGLDVRLRMQQRP